MVRPIFGAIFLMASLLGGNVRGDVRFNRDIRPILSDKCFFCHGFDDEERKAGVRLDTREGATTAKDGVVPIVPGDPTKSELMARVALPEADEDRMPPPDSHKEALTKVEVDLIRRWIEEGAVYEEHWAFTEVVRPEVPDAGDGWVREKLDRFIAARHAEEELEPSKEAEIRTLVRRVYFDLIGLPPTPEVVDQVEAGEMSYEELVDELLASPRFGERMGVYWLDLVRYADTVGLHGDQEVQISPYRDYVIRAFNENMPFDQFTVEQLAGDLLEDPSPVQIAATGYNRLNLTTHEGGAQRKEYEAIYGADRVRNVSSVWMGLTLGCAECHDHKFDPLSQRDFYTMKAFFADIEEDPIFQGAGNSNPTKRNPEMAVPGYEVMDAVEEAWADAGGREKAMAPLRKAFRTSLVTRAAKEPKVVRILPRGNWLDDSGEVVEPAFPEVFGGDIREGERLTRLDLARWLVDRKNPLTARVFVNRMWKMFFGKGLSKVLDDLGSQGEWPVHAELLDWLAAEFMESGWDVKHMVRMFVNSATYRQSSYPEPELVERDPFNRLVARQSSWRLPAEMVRDNLLEVAGLLVHKLGGPSARPRQPAGYYAHLNFPQRKYVADKGEGLYRRGIYTHWQRMFVHPAMLAFDAPTREECIAERPVSNTPLAALVLLNDPNYVEAANAFSDLAVEAVPGAGEGRVEWMFRLALNREPNEKEMGIALDLVDESGGWTALGRAILNLHETVTRM